MSQSRICSKLRFALLPGIVFAIGCASYPPEPKLEQPQTIEFLPSEVGHLPANFSTALTGGGGPVSWVLRKDVGRNGEPVLMQESQDETSYRFPLCIYTPLERRDVAVQTEWKAISGDTDEAGGVVLRYTPETYYIARANALEDNVNLFKTIRGKRIKIEEVPVKVTPQQWHTLRFEAKGPRLAVWFDGKLVIQSTDRSIRDAGQVGLWTKADSVSAFKNLRIEPAE